MLRYIIGKLRKKKAVWRLDESNDYWACTECGYKTDEAVSLDTCPRCGSDMLCIITHYHDQTVTMSRPEIVRRG